MIKEVIIGEVTYLAMKTEYGTPTPRVEVSAWEPATKHGAGFIGGSSHSHTYTDADKRLWGNVQRRRWSSAIELLTPNSPERVKAQQDFLGEADLLAAAIIKKAKLGEATNMTDQIEKPKAEKKPKTVQPYADEIKQIVGVADFPRLKELAKKNDVPVKDSDTAGLLKMRLMNAFRSKLTKGEKIVT